MTLSRVSPAPYHALAAMLRADPDVRAYGKLLDGAGAAKLNLVSSGALSFGVFAPGGACIACGGLVPLDPIYEAVRARDCVYGQPISRTVARPRYEAWFASTPALAPRLLGFVRLAQLTLRELPQDAIVEARVAPGWAPGEKLARLLGFRHAEGEIWTRQPGTTT